LEELFFDQSVASIKITPDELAALADGVTRAEVAEIASGIELDTVYYLAGASDNAPAVSAGLAVGGTSDEE
jgi:hypothetical protein